ncbi:PLD nuclease N-terminal domain-containing protein [Streptomyces sp. ME18-1-4]|uniref:PLD nuclease N-terminal domain-containing protein n=1 Tax=Streptomyces sp. ME18-1-4 TaxID=3028685 RepID=UPI0029A004C2|nr:PLD nuclease N-terminal domain-containing protein [Streptomyces sp. ME18-1-4]MDX3243801.1 PLD nuclease N-terminal domain-containing protein [Streptomyces sp. ME18-1-4]
MQTQLVHHMTLAATGGELIGAAVTAGFLLCGLACLVFFISTLVSILKSPLAGGMKVVWIILAFSAPFLGSLCWFVIGRKDAQRRPGIV